MRKWTPSILAAVFVLGVASQVQAQVTSNGTGPASVASDAASSVYTATVTTDYDFDFNLMVYHRGTLKHDRTTFVVNDGPVYYYQETVGHSGWGLAEGDPLDYRGRATLTEGPYQGSSSGDVWSITVSAPGGFLPRRRERTGDWA